jgi:hypothetical protein
MIRWNTQARVVQSAALAFFVRAERDAGRRTAGAPLWSPIPHADRATAPIHRLDCAAEDMPCRTNAQRSFSGARQFTSVAPSPRQGFSIGSVPTLRALDGDKSPLVWRADAPQNVWPAALLHG